jgi:hypothetical protein
VACTGEDETVSTVDSTGTAFLGSDSSIAIGTDGLPVISYYDPVNTALKVAKCNDPACSGGDETLNLVDVGGALPPGDDVGMETSIAIGSDGFPVISYHNQTNGDLKVADCDDMACSGSGETFVTVDTGASTGGDVGNGTALAIGNDGFPVIAYYDTADTELKVAHCNDPGCTGTGEIIATVTDGVNDVGQFPSIAIGADGFPVIVYLDLNTGSAPFFHLMKCNDPACVGGDEFDSGIGFSADATNEGQSSITVAPGGLPLVTHTTSAETRYIRCLDADCLEHTVSVLDGFDGIAGSDRGAAVVIGADGLPIVAHSTDPVVKATHCASLGCQ